MSRRWMMILFAMILACAMLPGTLAYAADGADRDHAKIRKDTIKELAAQLQDESRDPYGYVDGKGAKKQEVYPARFDLRNVDGKNYVTPVKLQNPFGSCWGFAAIAAAESSILSNPELNNDGEGNPVYSLSLKQGEDGKDVLDLSEKHLVYFTASAIDDPTSSQNGEGMHFFKQRTSGEKLNNGGLPFYATTLFSSGMGPNLTDREYPESAGIQGKMTDILAYHGKELNVEKRKINGKWVNFCYDADDDWSIEDAYRYCQSYVLKESYILPEAAHIAEDGTYTYQQAGTDAIKEQLMNGRAVQVGFTADQSSPSQDTNEGTFINYNTWAHYTYMPLTPNHAVTIVGWDDDYPATNFVSGHQPPGNGAWLIKNSWGSGEEAFPNKGTAAWGIPNEQGEGTGYFWLSYYDQSISRTEALAFDKSNVNKKYYLDQYDLMPVQTARSGVTATQVSTANAFTAEEAQLLEQVSCQTQVPGTHVTYDIYLLPADYSHPQDGVKMATEEATYEYGGFHKVTLSTPVTLQKGQSYGIVVTQTVPNGKYAYSMQLAIGKPYAMEMNLPYYCESVVNKGESFVCIDGEWTDLTDTSLIAEYWKDLYDKLAFDNFPIKGYSTPLSTEKGIRIVGNNTLSMIPQARATSTLNLRFHGSAGDFESDPEITWSLAEGSEDIISLTPADDGISCEVATVTAKKYGTGYVLVSVKGYGTTVVKISVKPHEFPECSLSKKKYTYDGKAHTPKVKVECGEGCGVLEEGKDYEVTYKDNVNAGKGIVLVKAFGDHDGEFEIPFTINKAAGKLTAKGLKVKVKASALKKKTKTIARKKAIKITKNTGKLSYKKLSGNKKITINTKTGKVMIKKKLKKGTYKLKVQITSAASRNYKKTSRNVIVKVIVK